MNRHPIRDEDLDLFALGGFSDEESEPIRAHVSSCEECARRLAEARGRIAMLSFAYPCEQPPSGAKQRLMQRIHDEMTSPGPSFQPKARTANLWNSLWAGALAALAIASVLLWMANRRLDNQLRQIEQDATTYQAQTEHAQKVVAVLSAQDTVTVKLASTATGSNEWGLVKYNERMGMMCYSASLPAPPPDKVYQMWMVPMVGEPVSCGVFVPGSAEHGRMPMAHVPSGVECKAFAVTIEPAGGRPRPTGPKILAGAL